VSGLSAVVGLEVVSASTIVGVAPGAGRGETGRPAEEDDGCMTTFRCCVEPADHKSTMTIKVCIGILL
jgi:hypothetical protein